MNRVDLVKTEHDIKVGQICEDYIPNITEDCVFFEDGKPIGFFIKSINGKLKEIINVANSEFRSKNVPKVQMDRSQLVKKANKSKISPKNLSKLGNGCSQYSTIIGSIPPNRVVQRDYPSRSSVHSVLSARVFIKSMLIACKESEKIVKEILPDQYDIQKNLILENVPERFRFGNLFTSSISNFNISAPFHRDDANLKGCVNVIITKKYRSKGGNLHIPDYGITIDSCDNSMLVYPAWKNIHGVTPITTSDDSGYRNSFVFYPLKSFKPYFNEK